MAGALGVADIAEVERTIQLAIAPAFLLTGIFALITILANRLARLIDRDRAVRSGAAQPLPEEYAVLARRARHLHKAIGASVLAAILLALLIVWSFVGVLFKLNVAWVLAGLLVGAMVAMMLALLLLLLEISLAFRHLPLPHDG